MTHALKTWPEYYKLIVSGEKPFELRKDDRPFVVGDTLILQEFNPEKNEYTGKESEFNIGYILRNAPNFGLKKGFCILGLTNKSRYA